MPLVKLSAHYPLDHYTGIVLEQTIISPSFRCRWFVTASRNRVGLLDETGKHLPRRIAPFFVA